MITTQTILIAAAFGLFSSIGYSILTAGKSGWGWFMIQSVLTTARWFFKILVSMFVEVTTTHCAPDWDEE